MKIKVEKIFEGRYRLLVNGYVLGEYFGGKSEIYKYPEKWAENQVSKRLAVINRNIARLEKELEEWKEEEESLLED